MLLFIFSRSVCNPILREEELSDKLLGAEANGFKDSILKLFEKEKFDLALTFTSGNDKNIKYLSNEPIYEQLANQIHAYNGPQSQNCSFSSFKLNEMDSLKKVTNMIYLNYNVPLFTVDLHCCKMPIENDLQEIWRETLPKLDKFMTLLTSGVTGFVKDIQGNSLRNALVHVINSKPYKVSKNLAFFHLILPYGEHQLEFTCDNYSRKVIRVNISNNLTSLNEVVLDFDAATVKKTYELTGFIIDENGKPIENAEVRLKNFQVNHVFTSSLGYYAIKDIKVDLVNITVSAKDFLSSERMVHMNPLGPTKNVIFKLKIGDEQDASLSNLLFIFSICLGILATVVLVTMFIVGGCSCPLRNGDKNRKKSNYKFSLLSKKQGRRQDLFDDEFSDDETEDILFKPSLRSEHTFYT